MNSKSQITLFMIIGLITLVLVGFLINFTFEQQKTSLQSNIKYAKQYVQSTPINYYISLCLEKSLKDSLKELQYTGLHIQDSKRVQFGTELLYYDIIKTKPNDLFATDPPIYPYHKFEEPIKSNANYYGENLLPALCDPSSKNSINSKLRCDSYDFNNSLQHLLSKKITEKTKSCLDFSFGNSSLKFYDLDYNLTNMSTELIFNENSVKATLNFPIKISFQNSEPVDETLRYESEIPVRLKRIHDLLYTTLKRETYELKFDLVKGFKKDPRYDSHIKIIKQPDYYGADTKVTIIDESSKIDTKPFTFSFLIENRNPALIYLGQKNAPDPYDYVYQIDETISFRPVAYDPDEEKVYYFYHGWKQDWDEDFDIQKFYSSNKNCKDLKSLSPNSNYKWTESSLFKSTEQDAGYYKLTERDVCEHNLTITVSDKHNNLDYQLINLFVEKPWQLLPNITSIFNTKYVSLEDPTIFYATGKGISAGLTSTPKNITWEIEGKPYNTPFKQQMVLPNNPDITNINSKIFTQLGKQNIRVISTGQFQNITVNVKKCLPHSDNNYPNPYPYGPEFTSSHVCCESNYEYSLSSKECYNYVGYGPKPKIDEKYEPIVNKLYTTERSDSSGRLYSRFDDERVTSIPEYLGSDNDIYKRTFSQKCSGNRGNVCAGEFNDDWTIYQSCDDTLLPNQDERCFGPPLQIKTPASSPTALSCVGYSDTTFEKEFLGTGDGICINKQKCTQKNSYKDSGLFLSQGATCGNGGCNKPINPQCSSQCGDFDLTYSKRINDKCEYYSRNNCKKTNKILLCANEFCPKSIQGKNYCAKTFCSNTGGGYTLGDPLNPDQTCSATGVINSQ